MTPTIVDAEGLGRSLAHRGPDGMATETAGPVALVHCRLAIIDLARGRQPLANESGSLRLIANCEIYNHRALRAELIERGHRFATDSDAEVLVHGYEEWGTALLDRLRGMYAFAIVDQERRRVFLARDPFGIKPLLYRRTPGQFVFASEMAGIRAAGGPSLDLARAQVELYLRYRYIPGPATIHPDVWKLPPGAWLSVAFDGLIDGPHSTTGPRFVEEEGSDAEWMARLEATLADSVAAHTLADVPYGVLLSGGIDSTLVASLAARAGGAGLPAFTVDFDDPQTSELAAARTVAERCGMTLHVERVDAASMRLLPDLARALGEPLGDPSFLPSWCLAHSVRRHVPMVLSGDGGDEAFAGYDSYASYLDFFARRSTIAGWVEAGRAGPRTLAWMLRQRLEDGGAPSVGSWEPQVTCFDPAARRALWKDPAAVITGTGEAFKYAGEEAAHRDPLSFAQGMDYRTYLPGNILYKVDAASMAHGLEVRTPLIDREVVALATRLPRRLRWGRGTDGRPIRKAALRTLLATTFPTALVDRPKQGFVGPHARWMRDDPWTVAELRRHFSDPAAPLARLFTAAGLRHELELHRADHDNSGRLWTLLMLGAWMEAHDLRGVA